MHLFLFCFPVQRKYTSGNLLAYHILAPDFHPGGANGGHRLHLQGHWLHWSESAQRELHNSHTMPAPWTHIQVMSIIASHQRWAEQPCESLADTASFLTSELVLCVVSPVISVLSSLPLYHIAKGHSNMPFPLVAMVIFCMTVRKCEHKF